MRGRQMLIPYLLLVAAAAGLLLLWQARRGAEVPVLGKVVSTGAAAVGGIRCRLEPTASGPARWVAEPA